MKNLINSIVNDCSDLKEMEKLYQDFAKLETSGDAWFNLNKIDSPFYCDETPELEVQPANLFLKEFRQIHTTNCSFVLEFSSTIGTVMVHALEFKKAIRLVKKGSNNYKILLQGMKALLLAKRRLAF